MMFNEMPPKLREQLRPGEKLSCHPCDMYLLQNWVDENNITEGVDVVLDFTIEPGTINIGRHDALIAARQARIMKAIREPGEDGCESPSR